MTFPSYSQIFAQSCAKPDRIEVGFDSSKIIVQFAQNSFDRSLTDEQRLKEHFSHVARNENLTAEIIHQV